MTERQDFSHWFEDEPRRGSTGMKLVLFGALLPVFLAALVIGGFLIARAPGEGAAATTATITETALDCSSARDAWRWACQKTVEAPAAAAIGDGPSTTGSIEHKTGR